MIEKKVKEINVILVKGQLNKYDVDNLIKLMNDRTLIKVMTKVV